MKGQIFGNEFEKGVFGPNYWQVGREQGVTFYKQFYYDRGEKGFLNVENVFGLRPFYLMQHHSYHIFRDPDWVTKMNRWEKYIKPGWNEDNVAKVDGNRMILENVSVKLPSVGFLGDYIHSDFAINAKWNMLESVKKKAVSIPESVSVALPLPKYNTGVVWGVRSDRGMDDWLGVSVGNVKMMYFDVPGSIYELSSKDRICAPMPWEKVYTYDFSKGALGSFNSNNSYFRGVVPGEFVKTYIDSEGKIYKMESFTKLGWPGGDLARSDRKIINEETLRYVLGEVDVHEASLYGYKQVGHDVVVSSAKSGLGEDEGRMIGVFEIDEWLRILRPVLMLHWAGEATMSLAAGFAAVSVANCYLFLLYKFGRLIWDERWDPSVRYSSYSYWDHRNLDVKTLEWAYLSHMREVLVLDCNNYMLKYQWVNDHCLSLGYGLFGFKLRLYEWLDLFSSGVVF